MKGWLAYWLRRIADWLTPSRPSLNDIVAMTMRNRSEQLADEVYRLKEKLRKAGWNSDE